MLTYRDTNGTLWAWNHLTGKAEPVTVEAR
jgi:hypothetical protein